MTNRKEMYARIFNWSQNEGKTPLESDINDLIWTIKKADAPADLDAALEALDDISAAFDVEEWTATDYADIGKNIQTIRETLTGRLSGVTKL